VPKGTTDCEPKGDTVAKAAFELVGVHPARLGLDAFQHVEADLDEVGDDIHDAAAAVTQIELAGGMHALIDAGELWLDELAPQTRPQ